MDEQEQKEIKAAYDGLTVREEGWPACVERTLGRLLQLRRVDLINVAGLAALAVVGLKSNAEVVQLADVAAMVVVTVYGQCIAGRNDGPSSEEQRDVTVKLGGQPSGP